MPPVLDACHRGIEGATPDALLMSLVEACAPNTEDVMPRADVSFVRGRAEATFELERAPRCLRVLIVSESPGALSVSVTHAGARPLAQQTSEGPFVVIDGEGPFCVAEAGTYRVALEGPDSGRAHLLVRSPP